MSGVSYEFSARTVDAAIAEGLEQLEVDRDAVQIEVLKEGSRGLLGIGSTNARIRITVPPEPEPEPPAPEPTTAPEKEPPPANEAAIPVEESEVAKTEVQTPAALEDGATEAVVAEETAVEETTVEEEAEDYAEEDYESEELIYGEVTTDELEELASGFLAEMISLMGFDADLEVSWEDDGQKNPVLKLNVVGADNLGTLIGRRGETISSVQYLIRLMVNQQIHRWTNIVIDVDGYKQRRADQLARMATRMAQQVMETGRGVALEPMPANERRIVHMTLRDHADVYTESTGEGDRRKVQILPK